MLENAAFANPIRHDPAPPAHTLLACPILQSVRHAMCFIRTLNRFRVPPQPERPDRFLHRPVQVLLPFPASHHYAG